MARKLLTREHLKPLFPDDYDKFAHPCKKTPRDRVLDHNWQPLQEQFALLEAVKEDNPILRDLSKWPRVSVAHDFGERLRPDDLKIIVQSDVTDLLFKACRSLKHNELVFGENFDLFQAMNAAELMEPKMDSGMEKRVPFIMTSEKAKFIQSYKWSEIDHITMCDAQLALIASWMINVESLDTTVFTNILALHPECADNDPILRAIFYACNWIVSMFINLVESAETLCEEDAMNRKTTHRFNAPNYRDVIGSLYKAIEINNSENAFNQTMFVNQDGSLKEDRPALRTYKEAVAVRLLFFKFLIQAISCAFPLLTRAPEPEEPAEPVQKSKKAKKQQKKPKKKKLDPVDQESPDIRSMSKNFLTAYSYVCLALESCDFGRAPPQGFDYENIEAVRVSGKGSKERTLFNEIASGFFDSNPDGDFAWLPTIIPDLKFHYLPNNFPHEVKIVSRHRAIYFFGHFLQELYDGIQSIVCLPWALDDIFATFYRFQKLHVVIRSFLELTVLTSKLKILYYYNLEDLTENGIDDFSTTYKMKQLTTLPFTISMASDPLPYFNLDEPDWPILDPEQLADMCPTAEGISEEDRMHRLMELRRFSYLSTMKQLIYDLSRVHSHHLQYLVHSMFHFRLRMCTNLAGLYASYLPKAQKLEACMERSMMSYNRKAFEDHIDLVKKTGEQRPLPQRFTGCPPLISSYIQYHTFMLTRTHFQQTLHLEIIPMAELDMVMFLYLCVLRRFGTLIKRQMCGFDTYTKLPVTDSFARSIEEKRVLEMRAQERICPNILTVAAEVQMCLVVLALIQILKKEGLVQTPPNEETLFLHRCKQSIPQTVREECEVWQFNPSYSDFKSFLNFMSQDYLQGKPPCISTPELCTYANIQFLRAKELYTHIDGHKTYARELASIDRFLKEMSQLQHFEKNAFKFTFPNIDSIMIFEIETPGAPETRPPRLASPISAEEGKNEENNVEKATEELRSVQIEGEKKKKKGKR
ncbi:unnamed protein product [Bursaphelenchus xylophilus]|uniref:(pine wood nematode) hypothetical protein n=1 Tax=Bursaphelenchus xylophilus TaxID=6326 RepID=A0A1I7RTS6_BURXY|nr:unnamed protein product [Bursaphelenchus xylophilus]CAG9122157.1 unnamed protein product [Bursaphelenchus xylophilus]